ncbi:transglutaminase domain-containing protein [Saccharopolyspora sp. HNM0983]|uniref:Transglutaminase domain-containing protein n=2 Tax=Saccharopolyspora montiporae TaxID=2781240 RepID=A0A929FZZ4_9PSEU|nr:DUF3488 and transglutaminase-like domain-containing protein [Saccharopolyspora sp. HNM0983]MBE9374272.1 transglutaminase domain-containing protein [Saccharopolyspora sp. HNM0983]
MPVDVPVLRAAAAAVAVLGAGTAFAGVLADGRWFPPALLTVLVIAATGAAGRSIGRGRTTGRRGIALQRAAVVLAQLAALAAVLTALFAGSGVLGFLPGPAALAELGRLLAGAVDLVRTGTPPVAAEPALQCLVCVGLGVVAVIVDLVAAALASPAATGLVLLCVFAIPASLAREMLPWWSFLAGAAGFALLLSTGGPHRRWQRREPGGRVLRGLFSGAGAALAATAGVLALLSGVVFTGVGTEGRLPGSAGERLAGGTEGIGLQPFTSLRGQLNRDRVVDLFRVRGLEQETYLRAMTLRKFDPEKGWALDGLTQGVQADDELPLPEGTTVAGGPSTDVEIEPLGYRDPWLPVFGTPTAVGGIGPAWRYDPAAGIVFTQSDQDSAKYTQRFFLAQPSPQDLREAGGPAAIAPEYFETRGIPPQVADLAKRVTADAPTDFDKAAALNRFFTDPANGFRYDLSTAPATDQDALTDFLFHGKRGFCEQYASSMAIMLRSVGVPARVSVGFTPGYRDGADRVITTEDAHAWVEAYFPGWGWQTFDPTPLDDGRAALPEFLEDGQPAPDPQPGEPLPPEPSGQAPPPDPQEPAPEPVEQEPPRDDREQESAVWPGVVAGSVLLLAVLATPATARELRRRQLLRAVAAGGRGSASTAWRLLLDEYRDRGWDPAPSETARMISDSAVERFGLDDAGAEAVAAVRTAAEREWYGAPEDGDPQELAATVRRALEGLDRTAPRDLRARVLPRSLRHLDS